MANEITFTDGMTVTNGNLSVSVSTTTTQFDQTTAKGGQFTWDVGTSEETLSFGDISPGWVRLINLDSTNYVRIGFATGAYGARLLANKGDMKFYLESGTTIYGIANTAECSVQVIALNS